MRLAAFAALLCCGCAAVYTTSTYDPDRHLETCHVVAVAAGQSSVTVNWRPTAAPPAAQLNIGLLAAPAADSAPVQPPCAHVTGGLASAGFWQTLVTLGAMIAPILAKMGIF